jgi:hypothetical protein
VDFDTKGNPRKRFTSYNKKVMGHTNIKGDIAELAVAKKFLERGCRVSYPFGDDSPYDLIVDEDDKLYRVQVKHRKPYRGSIPVKLISESGVYYSDTVDLVVCYEPESGKMYMINPQEFKGVQRLLLRVEPPKNGQIEGINLAENFEI